MDKRTRKLMTMHKGLHPSDDVDRLLVPRKETGRGLTNIEHTVDVSIQRLKDYIEKHRGSLITSTISITDNAKINRTEITRKQKWEEKLLYRRFMWNLSRENVNVAKKGKPYGRNWISSNSSSKQRHKDQSYQSNSRLDVTELQRVVISWYRWNYKSHYKRIM